MFKSLNFSKDDIEHIIKAENTESSDLSRASILKLYTYESDLYKKLNYALQTKDKNAVDTIGAFSMLLTCTLYCPPKLCLELEKELL